MRIWIVERNTDESWDEPVVCLSKEEANKLVKEEVNAVIKEHFDGNSDSCEYYDELSDGIGSISIRDYDDYWDWRITCHDVDAKEKEEKIKMNKSTTPA